MGEAAIIHRPRTPLDQYMLIDAVLAAYAIYWWYWLDKCQRGFRAGTFQNMAVAVIAVIGMPIYLFRSRGLARGAVATVAAGGIYLAAGMLSILGEIVGKRIAL
jgi:hypothetical protein